MGGKPGGGVEYIMDGGDDVSSAMMTTAIMEAWTTTSAVLAVRVRWEQ